MAFDGFVTKAVISELNQKIIGAKVNKGDLLCTIYTNKSKEEYLPVIEEIKAAYKFSKEKVEILPVIREVIRK